MEDILACEYFWHPDNWPSSFSQHRNEFSLHTFPVNSTEIIFILQSLPQLPLCLENFSTRSPLQHKKSFRLRKNIHSSTSQFVLCLAMEIKIFYALWWQETSLLHSNQPSLHSPSPHDIKNSKDVYRIYCPWFGVQKPHTQIIFYLLLPFSSLPKKRKFGFSIPPFPR